MTPPARDASPAPSFDVRSHAIALGAAALGVVCGGVMGFAWADHLADTALTRLVAVAWSADPPRNSEPDVEHGVFVFADRRGVPSDVWIRRVTVSRERSDRDLQWHPRELLAGVRLDPLPASDVQINLSGGIIVPVRPQPPR